MSNNKQPKEIIDGWAQWKKDIVYKKQPKVKCPFCGSFLKNVSDYTYGHWRCINKKVCGVDIIDPCLSHEETLKRISKRPESAWEMFRRLQSRYGNQFDLLLKNKIKATSYMAAGYILLSYDEQEAITIMQQIEKDLKE